MVVFNMQENGEAPPPAAADMDTDKAPESAEAEAAKPKKQVKKIQLPVDALDELTNAEINKYQVRVAAIADVFRAWYSRSSQCIHTHCATGARNADGAGGPTRARTR